MYIYLLLIITILHSNAPFAGETIAIIHKKSNNKIQSNKN